MTFSLPFPWLFNSNYLDDQDDDSDQTGSSQSETAATDATTQSLVSLLELYDTPGVPPPSARIDPLLNQEVRKPLRIFDLWKYGYFVASKGAEITSDIMAHYIWGPRRPSWGIEMTLISSLMRNTGKHSQLADITTIRSFMQIGGLVPLPSNAMVTPLTFRVRKRNLRGLLAVHDAMEDGHREITGEWVVGKRLWQRLQAEWKASRANKRKRDTQITKSIQRVVLYLHGGAYYVFSAATHRLITIPLSKFVGARVFAIDYRLAPETRFPGPLHDAVSAYFRLLDDLHIPPENILLAGDSAGGGLSLGLLMYLRDNNYPMPAGAILLSPWVDLTMSCDSWDSNAPYDVIPRPNANDHLNPVACYLGEEGLEKYLTHPYASPLFGNFKSLPPMLVQSGDAEVLRDEITLLAHKATLAGVEVRHELFQDAVHVFQMFPFLDATHKSFQSCREFVRDILPRYQSHSPRVLESAQLAHETGNTESRIVRGDGVEIETTKPACEEMAADESGHSSSGTKDAVAAMGDPDAEDFGWETWKGRGALPHSTSPQERDGTSIDLDTHPMVPFTPPFPTSSDSGLLPVQYMSIPPMQVQALAPVRRPKGFTISHAAPTLLSPPYTPVSKKEQLHSNVSIPSSRRLPLVSSTEQAIAPTPTIRSRHRAISHPDMVQLCRDWAQGPANQTTTYKPK
ncbi:alpha/beta-hydrolase [Ramaria rubella]|nr:alpha/beta-hydrolase [Ramaria rubella]